MLDEKHLEEENIWGRKTFERGKHLGEENIEGENES